MNRRAARTDSNHAEIAKVFRDLGAPVHHTHAVGAGFPDLVVGFRGVNLLIEIKDGGKPPSRRRLTSDEERWHDEWRGRVHVVESEEDAIALLNHS